MVPREEARNVSLFYLSSLVAKKKGFLGKVNKISHKDKKQKENNSERA